MAPRPRSRKNANLPPNLYCQDGYYHYRHPQTRKTYGLGRDKGSAITQAIEANLHIYREAVKLLDRIQEKDKRTVSAWCDHFGDAPRIKYLRDGIGHYMIEDLTPLQINEWLDSKWSDKPRMRQIMLSLTKRVLRAAIGKGWIEKNPASELTTETPVVARERLSMEDFMRIHAAAPKVLQRFMELALMTGARRENIASLKWADIKDGYLHIVHIKSKKNEHPLMVRYPLTMKLEATGWTLNEVIQRCRTNIISKHILHHTNVVGKGKVGDCYTPTYFTILFQQTRESLGIKAAEGRTPPTVHEIRALAKQQWDLQGADTRVMLGHKSDTMQSLYRDRRGKDWLTLTA